MMRQSMRPRAAHCRRKAILLSVVGATLLDAVTLFAVPASLEFDGLTYERVAQTESLALFFNEETCAIMIRDLRTESDWCSRVSISEPAFSAANRQWKARMQSLFTFSHFDRTRDSGNRTLASAALEEHTVVVSRILSGIRLDYVFTNLGLGITVEITIRGAELVFTVPSDSVTEEGRNGWVSVEPLPFLGAAPDTADGYALLPDGPGALYRFKETTGSYSSEYGRIRWHAYSPAKVDLETYDRQETEGYRNAYIPAFGIRMGDSAFAALVEAGAEDSSIMFTQSGQAVDLTRVHPELLFRHQYELFLSEISIQGTLPGGAAPVKFDTDRIPGPRSVRYFFLADSSATYSGMATVLRQHFLATGALRQSDRERSIPLALSVLGGVTEERLLIDRYLAMTTFDQIAEMVDYLQHRGVASIRLNLVGWARGGYGRWPTLWPPERRLGGAAGLRELLVHNHQAGVSTYLQTNMIDAIQANRGINTRTQTVKQGNSLPVTDELRERFLINPWHAANRFGDLLGHLHGEPAAGMTFERIGELVYQDYNVQHSYQRRETIGVWEQLVGESTRQFGGVALTSAFLGLAGDADILFDLPMEGSDLVALDEQVPFYQMVLHGSVPYSSVPGNLFYDQARQLLQWIEYGCIPHYFLTYNSAELLRDTELNYLFSAQFSRWVDQAVAVYERFNRELGGFYDQPIIEHLRIGGSGVRLTFADGSLVYLNYADESTVMDGVPVGATDFAVARGTPAVAGGR